MRLIHKTYAAAVLGLAAIGCNKVVEPVATEAGTIRIAAGVADTKAMLTNDDLIGQTEIKVFDILSDGSYTKHIDDAASFVAAGEAWQLKNEPESGSVKGYSWRPDGKVCNHNFFTWLSKDKDGQTPEGYFGTGFGWSSPSPEKVTVNVPAKKMLLSSDQFDFSMSDIVTRDVATANYSMVNMNLKHFFSAFGIKAHNYDNDAIIISSVKLYGIKNTKSATVTYDCSQPSSQAVVSYANQASDWATEETGLELLKEGTKITLAPDAEVSNIITCAAGGNKSQDAKDAFYLMWPQTVAEMASSYDPDGDLIVDFSHAILAITFNAGGLDYVTKYVSLCPIGTEQGWDAGSCHQIELSFTNKFIELSVSVLPWLYLEKEVNYDKMIACNEGGELTFVEDSYYADPADPTKIYFKNSATPIKGYFSLARPINGSWMISKVGDFDAFEIDNIEFGQWGDKVDYAYGTIDGSSLAYFSIYPKDQDPKRDYQIKLAFAVRNTAGNVYAADDVIQGQDPSKYITIILQTMN